MIRPFTVLTMLLAAISGASLFAVKHHAQVLADQITAATDATRLDEQRIRVLQAQWALETDPTRLARLAAQFTTLSPMKPSQLITLSALRGMLPPAGRVPPGANPVAVAPGGAGPIPMPMPGLALAGAAPPVQAGAGAGAGTGALPLPPAIAPQPPVRLAETVAARAASGGQPALSSRMSRGHSMLHLADTAAVHDLPPPRSLSPPRSLYAAINPGAGAAVLPVRAAAAPPPVADPNGGSLLGMAAALPPSGTPN